MATKIDRLVTWGGGTPLLKSCDLLIAWSRDKLKIPMVIRLGRVVTYLQKNPHT